MILFYIRIAINPWSHAAIFPQLAIIHMSQEMRNDETIVLTAVEGFKKVRQKEPALSPLCKQPWFQELSDEIKRNERLRSCAGKHFSRK